MLNSDAVTEQNTNSNVNPEISIARYHLGTKVPGQMSPGRADPGPSLSHPSVARPDPGPSSPPWPLALASIRTLFRLADKQQCSPNMDSRHGDTRYCSLSAHHPQSRGWTCPTDMYMSSHLAIRSRPGLAIGPLSSMWPSPGPPRWAPGM